MLMATLFTITRKWNQPRSPSAEEWIMKMWNIYAMELYSATKKNEIMKLAVNG